jgi:hypothetical protein
VKLTWYSAGTEEPLDEQADIMAGYWAVIGPDGEGRFGWTVVAPTGGDAASGRADDADAAKAAVSRWDRQMVDYSTGRSSTPPDGLAES